MNPGESDLSKLESDVQSPRSAEIQNPKVEGQSQPVWTAKERAYNTWFQMNRGAIPFDEELLKRLNAEAEAEEKRS